MRNKIFGLLLILSSLGLSSPFDHITLVGSQAELKALQASSNLARDYMGQKYVLTRGGELIVSLSGQTYPTHKELSNNQEVIAAGYIRLAKFGNGNLAYIRINNKSKDFCLSPETLPSVGNFLVNIVPGIRVKSYNEPSDKCP